MFFDYLALAILLMGLTLVFFVFVYIHDLPHAIAKKRHHPHEEAIHVACWLSLFTLHALWPFVFMWAVMHKPETERALAPAPDGPAGDPQRKIAELEERLRKLEGAK